MHKLKSERRSNEADPLPAFRNYFEKDGFLKGLQLGLDEIEHTRDVASCGFQFDSSKRSVDENECNTELIEKPTMSTGVVTTNPTLSDIPSNL